jgi:uncharacterized membrane protein YkvA (DUF1232 family)
MDEENIDYKEHYSEESFWGKVKKYGRKVGAETLEKVLILYYVGIDPLTPKWAKGVIAGALGYFIFPLDAIPDLTPIVGYADDLGAITAAIATIAMCITKEHRKKAKEKLKEWVN